MPQAECVTILLIEDDAGHARLIEKNLRRSGIHNPLITAEDGQKAVDLLFGGGLEARSLSMSRLLILLDLNLPVISGYELLTRIKSSPETHKIPVVILTTTDDEREINTCYKLGCNVYVTKPMEYEAFTAAIRSLGLLLSVVSIPTAGAS